MQVEYKLSFHFSIASNYQQADVHFMDNILLVFDNMQYLNVPCVMVYFPLLVSLPLY